MAIGWAIDAGEGVIIETVSPTKRAAMCNWLVVNKSAVAGVLVKHVLPDSHIEAMRQSFPGVCLLRNQE